MRKLVEAREAEQREVERRRKEEWAQQRVKELEGLKEWEEKFLRTLRVQHSDLTMQLNQLVRV